MNTRKIVLTGVMAALVTVGTLLIQIPSGISGYIHLGDSIIYFSGIVLGPVFGALAAGIGSMFADIFSGYALYAIPSLIIKGLDAFCIATVYRALTKDDNSTKKKLMAYILSFVVGSLVMVSGYFIFESFIYGIAGGVVAIIPNSFQGLIGGVISVPLFLAYLKRNLRDVLKLRS